MEGSLSSGQLLRRSLQRLKETSGINPEKQVKSKRSRSRSRKGKSLIERHQASAVGKDWTAENTRTLTLLKRSAKLPQRLKAHLLKDLDRKSAPSSSDREKRTKLMGVKFSETKDKMKLSTSSTSEKSIFSEKDFEALAMEVHSV